MTVFDPFGTVGVGSAVNVIGGPLAPLGIQAFPPGAAYPLVRTSNSIGWLSQNMNGFRAQVQYALSQQGTDCVTPNTAVNGNTCWGANGDGKLMAYRLTYTSGPLTLAAASSTTQYGNVATNAAPNIAGATGPAFANTAAYRGDYTVTNFAAAYVMGATRFTFQSGNQTNEATAGNAPERKLSNTHLGVAHTMGATTLKASINTAKRSDGAAIGTNGEDGAKAKQIAVGAVYDLSKRTALYGTYSKADLTAGPVTGGALRANLAWAGPALAANASNSAKGIDIGIRHRF
jgi:predicted porin